MCLIIHAEPGQVITDGLLYSAATHNQDGWGLLVDHPEEGLTVRKSLDMAALGAAVRAAPLDSHRAVHLRLTTHGGNSLPNTHPFEVDPDTWFMHNGILGKWGMDDRSDTRHFVEDFLAPLLRARPDFYDSPAFTKALEEITGSTNRFLLYRRGRSPIFTGQWYVTTTTPDRLSVSNTYSFSLAGMALGDRLGFDEAYREWKEDEERRWAKSVTVYKGGGAWGKGWGGRSNRYGSTSYGHYYDDFDREWDEERWKPSKTEEELEAAAEKFLEDARRDAQAAKEGATCGGMFCDGDEPGPDGAASQALVPLAAGWVPTRRLLGELLRRLLGV